MPAYVASSCGCVKTMPRDRANMADRWLANVKSMPANHGGKSTSSGYHSLDHAAVQH